MQWRILQSGQFYNKATAIEGCRSIKSTKWSDLAKRKADGCFCGTLERFCFGFFCPHARQQVSSEKITEAA